MELLSFSSFAKQSIRFCETNLNGFIAQPANAFSSLVISLIGIIVLNQKEQHRYSKLVGWSVILAGGLSFFYHASNTFIGQLLDLGSMFLLASLLLVIALRKQKRDMVQDVLSITYGTLIPVALVLAYRLIGGINLGIPLFIVMVLAAVYLEIQTALAEKRDLSLFGLSVLVFWGGWIFWLLDYRGIWCNPDSSHIFNAHALWHISNAAALYLLNRYYAKK
jgi:hypothetical protein